MVAANSILPPLNLLPASIFKGNEPSRFKYWIEEPLAVNASTRGPMGLSCIRAFPVRTTCLGPLELTSTRAATVVKKREAVPAFPR